MQANVQPAHVTVVGFSKGVGREGVLDPFVDYLAVPTVVVDGDGAGRGDRSPGCVEEVGGEHGEDHGAEGDEEGHWHEIAAMKIAPMTVNSPEIR